MFIRNVILLLILIGGANSCSLYQLGEIKKVRKHWRECVYAGKKGLAKNVCKRYVEEGAHAYIQ